MFVHPDSFEEGSYFEDCTVRMPLSCDLSDVFSMIRLKLRLLGNIFPFVARHIKGPCYDRDLQYRCWLKWCSPRFPTAEPLIPAGFQGNLPRAHSAGVGSHDPAHRGDSVHISYPVWEVWLSVLIQDHIQSFVQISVDSWVCCTLGSNAVPSDW